MSLEVEPRAIDPKRLKDRLDYLDDLEAKYADNIQWNECDTPTAYRRMRREGLNGFIAPVRNPKAKTFSIRGRDGHEIELRIISPEDQPSKGAWLHFHAGKKWIIMSPKIFLANDLLPGGFVIGSNASYDHYLTTLSNSLCLTMVSVEYRLAPENPFPACLNDCTDAALYALTHIGERELGAPLKILGGESAGGWLAVSTALELRRDHGVNLQTRFDAIVTGYGIFDLTYTPSLLQHKRDIVLSRQGMMDFVEAAFGNIPQSKRKEPIISPLYADLHQMPPALFLTGDIEPLMDDSLFMAARWKNAGNTTDLQIIRGACHAFTIIEMGDATMEGLNIVIDFVKSKLRSEIKSD